jgi:hypothetical protein
MATPSAAERDSRFEALSADDMAALVALLSLGGGGDDGADGASAWQQEPPAHPSPRAAAAASAAAAGDDDDDCAPLPSLPPSAYLAGLPDAVRRGAGEATWDAEAAVREAAGGAGAPAPAAARAPAADGDGDGDDGAALAAAEFEKYLSRLPPDVAAAARGLQEVGRLDARGQGGDEAESEYYRAYLELLAGVRGDRQAAEAAAEALAGVKRRRGGAAAAPATQSSSAPAAAAAAAAAMASPSHAPADDAAMLRELG